MIKSDYLRVLRREKEVTQQDLADALGVTQPAYSKKEKTFNFKIDELNKMRMYMRLTDKEYWRLIGAVDTKEWE